MFFNYLAAALSNLARSRLYASISIAGLAVGICAVMLALLVLRSELGYDRFILGYDRVYLTVSTLKPKQHAAASRPFVSHTLAAALKLKFPQIAAVARLADQTVALQSRSACLVRNTFARSSGAARCHRAGSVHSLGPRPPQAGASRGRSSGRPSKWAPVRSRCPECAGLYPALILSSFRPAIVLKGIVVRVTGANVARQWLVALQFAVLIGMLVSAAVVYQQREFALSDALRVQTDQHLIVEAECPWWH